MLILGHSRRLSVTVCVCLWLILCNSLARAAELHESLPDDTLAFIEVDPLAAVGGAKAKQPAGSPLLSLGVEAMQSLGVLPKGAELVGDALALASIAGEHRSCLALLDAELSATPDGQIGWHSVQVAWIIEMPAAEAQVMIARLTRLMNHFATQDTATQEVKRTPETHREYVEFRDNRWPRWLKLAWTHREGRFIFTMGAGAMEHYLAERPVGGVPWAQTVASADAEAQRLNHMPATTLMRVYVAAKTIRERFPEPVRKTNLGRILASVGFDTQDAGLMTVRSMKPGRAITIDAAALAAGKVTLEPWTVNLTPDSPVLKLVPPEATAYLALKMDWPKTYDRVLAILEATVKRADNKPIERIVTDFAAREGVDIRKHILHKLSPIVIVHDAPAHPLKLPLMVTAVGAAADDQPAAASAKLMAALKTMLDVPPKKSFNRAVDLTRFRIRTDNDNVTYTQFGLVGPAWTWQDNKKWIFSWSPAAVRYNQPFTKSLSSESFSLPVPSR